MRDITTMPCLINIRPAELAALNGLKTYTDVQELHQEANKFVSSPNVVMAANLLAETEEEYLNILLDPREAEREAVLSMIHAANPSYLRTRWMGRFIERPLVSADDRLTVLKRFELIRRFILGHELTLASREGFARIDRMAGLSDRDLLVAYAEAVRGRERQWLQQYDGQSPLPVAPTVELIGRRIRHVTCTGNTEFTVRLGAYVEIRIIRVTTDDPERDQMFRMLELDDQVPYADGRPESLAFYKAMYQVLEDKGLTAPDDADDNSEEEKLLLEVSYSYYTNDTFQTYYNRRCWRTGEAEDLLV